MLSIISAINPPQITRSTKPVITLLAGTASRGKRELNAAAE